MSRARKNKKRIKLHESYKGRHITEAYWGWPLYVSISQNRNAYIIFELYWTQELQFPRDVSRYIRKFLSPLRVADGTQLALRSRSWIYTYHSETDTWTTVLGNVLSSCLKCSAPNTSGIGQETSNCIMCEFVSQQIKENI